MNKILAAAAIFLAPAFASAATIIVEGGGPYDVTSDRLFTGIVISGEDGPGSYTVDFFTSGEDTFAVADAAVTNALVNEIFTGLTMSWLDGETLNAIVQGPGIDTLSTLFAGEFRSQRLEFSWSNSQKDAGFGFDVTVAPIPLPASVMLLAAGLGGLGLVGRRRSVA